MVSGSSRPPSLPGFCALWCNWCARNCTVMHPTSQLSIASYLRKVFSLVPSEGYVCFLIFCFHYYLQRWLMSSQYAFSLSGLERRILSVALNRLHRSLFSMELGFILSIRSIVFSLALWPLVPCACWRPGVECQVLLTGEYIQDLGLQ